VIAADADVVLSLVCQPAPQPTTAKRSRTRVRSVQTDELTRMVLIKAMLGTFAPPSGCLGSEAALPPKGVLWPKQTPVRHFPDWDRGTLSHTRPLQSKSVGLHANTKCL